MISFRRSHFCLRAALTVLGVVVAAQLFRPVPSWAQAIEYSGSAAELTFARVSDRTLEVQLAPIGADGAPVEPPPSQILVDYPREVLWSGRTVPSPVEQQVGDLVIEIRSSPLTVSVRRADGSPVQTFSWPDRDGAMHFRTEAPVFGLGHGGPQFDRRGHRLPMRDGWGAYERPTHGSRVAAPMLIGADGWFFFVHHPISNENVFDLQVGRGVFEPSEKARAEALRLLVSAWDEPAQIFSEYRLIAGPTPLPPLWALGYMQSHRTLEDSDQILRVAQTFRTKQLPIDAVIYLGTGFTPSGWNQNMREGSFAWNRLVFDDPPGIIRRLHDLDLKVVLHNYNPPSGLYGTSAEPGDADDDDDAHLANYWQQHVPVFELGIDGWWPDGGENNAPESRVVRHRMYRVGPLYSRPNERPWSFHRTGYSGAHRYGGFIWSGDPDSYWETLRTQIAVGLNHVVSLTPFWGSDTGGFLPSLELTGELYVRWFQFSTFCTSFRSHGRAWHLRLPWGWNTAELGPAEVDAYSDAFEHGYPYPEELRNGLVEPIARQFLHLRYQLLSYNYGLVRETHDTGVPPMRAMWLEHPSDPEAVLLDDQYMWGRDLLIAPVYEKGATERTLYLPPGDWYDFWTNERAAGGHTVTRNVDLATMPIYVRAGTILPLDPIRQHTSQRVSEPITFQVYPGQDGEFRWYQDDGHSLDYERGAFSWTRVRWDDDARRLTMERDPDSPGGAPPPARRIRVSLRPSGATQTIDWDGTRAEVTFPPETEP